MNKITILSISAVFVASILAINAFEAEAKPPTQSVSCPAENVQHWLNVRVNNEAILQHNTEPTIPKTALLIPVQTATPQLFDFVNMKQLVADRFNELGYFVDDGGIRPVEIADVTPTFLNEAPYSTICAEN